MCPPLFPSPPTTLHFRFYNFELLTMAKIGQLQRTLIDPN